MFNFLYVLDIDECLNSDSFCADNTTCTNIAGGYDCSCLLDYITQQVGDEYQPNVGCSKLYNFTQMML